MAVPPERASQANSGRAGRPTHPRTVQRALGKVAALLHATSHLWSASSSSSTSDIRRERTVVDLVKLNRIILANSTGIYESVCRRVFSALLPSSINHHQSPSSSFLSTVRREDHVLLEPSNGNQSSNHHHKDVHRGGCSAFFNVLPNES